MWSGEDCTSCERNPLGSAMNGSYLQLKKSQNCKWLEIGRALRGQPFRYLVMFLSFFHVLPLLTTQRTLAQMDLLLLLYLLFVNLICRWAKIYFVAWWLISSVIWVNLFVALLLEVRKHVYLVLDPDSSFWSVREIRRTQETFWEMRVGLCVCLIFFPISSQMLRKHFLFPRKLCIFFLTL